MMQLAFTGLYIADMPLAAGFGLDVSVFQQASWPTLVTVRIVEGRAINEGRAVAKRPITQLLMEDGALRGIGMNHDQADRLAGALRDAAAKARELDK